MHQSARRNAHKVGGGRWVESNSSSVIGGRNNNGDTIIVDIMSGSNGNNNNSYRRKLTRSPYKKKIMTNMAVPLATIMTCLIVCIWLVVFIQFYLHGLHHDVREEDVTITITPQEYNPPPPQKTVVNVNINPAIATSSTTTSTPDHYMAFSTACSTSQDWQSFILFYFAHKVSQPGYVVRIASGCSEQQQSELRRFHDTVVSKLSPNFLLHFTPDFSKKGGDSYKYFNKPYGLQHWFQYGLKYDENMDKYKDAIFIVLDPDMMLLRPMTYDFTESNVIIHDSKRGRPTVRKVLHGQPWASIYGFGNGPFRVDLNDIFGKNVTDSPALSVTSEEQMNNYPGGPPYMATGGDMYAIINQWCEIVVQVHRALPRSILAEMYGWSLAAAHLKLPHTLAESFMISDADIALGEGWPLIDKLNLDEISDFSTTKTREEHLPYVIHYCQNYWLGKWFIGKYRLASDWMSCEQPLLREPPRDIGERYDFYIKPGGNPYGTKEKLSPAKVKRNQFMLHQIIARFNDAATWIKNQTCDRSMANYEKSLIFHYSLDPDNNDGGEKKIK